ncbi:MAG: GTP 3',8-cyclase MoaA [Candidatus Porifericomitaceae bacterium WSBS_2022_MAG_OTU9]
MSTAATALPEDVLIDGFGRRINYVRISVTDRCDFRCVYCMKEDMTFLPRSQVLSLEEIALIVKAFTELGVGKIRVTGGEPLVRNNIMHLMHKLGQLPMLGELVLTTNGSQLAKLAPELLAAGVRRINISLDTLKPERFSRISRTGKLETVLAGIAAAVATGFEKIKLNAVILRNRNEDEVCDLAAFAGRHGMDISYIEEMPLGVIDDHDRAEAYYSSDNILRDLEQNFTLGRTDLRTGGPSKYWRNEDTGTLIGLISPHSHNFCGDCNRVRVTAEGRLLLCLGQEHSVDLRQIVREQPGNIEVVKQAIRDSMSIKPKGHNFSLQEKPIIMRHMSVTGG